jgi:hypothetical protein
MARNTRRSSAGRGAIGVALCAMSAAMLGACGGGSSSSSSSNTPAAVAGKVTYDFVPTSVTVSAAGQAEGGLNYGGTQQLPVRHAVVELVSDNGSTVLGQTSTDDSGNYSIAVPAGKQVYVRVEAQASAGPENAPDYTINIRDNTAAEYLTAPGSAPIYSMRGNVFTTTSHTTQVNLNAGSGWTGASYGAPRTAAPFAILDQTVNAAQKLHAAAPDVPLPALNVFWSVNNRPNSDTTADDNSGSSLARNNRGLVGTSHYEGGAATGLYILGAENVDTDEYDTSVLVHEFGHYVENNVSRSDSIGGSHANGESVDMRVAFGEGFGNAFSSIMRGTPVYSDTIGPKQGRLGVYMRLDQVPATDERAWYNEAAVGNFLYEVSQAPDIGFAPMYQALLTGEKTTPAETSIFSFAAALRPGLSDAGKRELDQLLAAVNVQGGDALDAWGTRTASPGAQADANPAVYPVYLPIPPGQTITACTTTQFGTGNKLGNYRHMRVTIPAAGRYSLLATLKEGDTGKDDFYFYPYAMGKALPDLPQQSGSSAAFFDFPAAGDYPVDVASNAALEEATGAGTAPRCIDVTLQSANQ